MKYLWIALSIIFFSNVSYAETLLVPQSTEEVVRYLQADVFKKSGSKFFLWEDNSVPLKDMDKQWLRTVFFYNPEIKSNIHTEISPEDLRKLQSALQKDAISHDEYVIFQNALLDAGKFSPDTLATIPLFNNKVSSWSFSRDKGDLHQSGTVTDVSIPFNKPVMTMITFNSVKSNVDKSLTFATCLFGVTCFFDPHIETTVNPSEDYVDTELLKKLRGFGVKQNALNKIEAENYLTTFSDLEYDTPIIKRPLRIVKSDSAPHSIVLFFDSKLEDNDLTEQVKGILALADDSLLVSDMGTMVRYNIVRNKLEKINLPFQFESMNIDIKGDVFGFEYKQKESNLSYLTKWSPDKGVVYSIKYGVLAPLGWFVSLSGNVVFLDNGRLVNISGDTGNVISKEQHWDWSSRFELSELLDKTALNYHLSDVQFNDELLWRTDRDVYGISVDSGKTVRSIFTDEDISFGSLSGGWAVARWRDNKDAFLRVVDTRSGQARIDLRFGDSGDSIDRRYGFDCPKLARTAHGRLLSSTDGTYVVVWDMQREQAVSRINIPQGFKYIAGAFNRKGDKLWLYMADEQERSHIKIGQWLVPESYQEPVTATDLPDQQLCNIW